MLDEFDIGDLDGARKNPRKYLKGLNKFIRKSERGYHSALHARVAGFLAVSRSVLLNFELFKDLRQEKCFEDDTKVLSATEDNFQRYVASCVVKLGCFGSDVLPSTRSKCTTIVKDCLVREVQPKDCADLIKAWGGFEATYQLAKAAKASRTARETKSPSEKSG